MHAGKEDLADIGGQIAHGDTNISLPLRRSSTVQPTLVDIVIRTIIPSMH